MEELIETRVDGSEESILGEDWTDQMVLVLEHLLKDRAGAELQKEMQTVFPGQELEPVMRSVLESRLFEGLLPEVLPSPPVGKT